MSTQVVVTLPDDLYAQAQRWAALTHREVVVRNNFIPSIQINVSEVHSCIAGITRALSRCTHLHPFLSFSQRSHPTR